MSWRWVLVFVLALSGTAQAAQPSGEIGAAYFEGRWSLLEESCEAPTNWTMIAGGNFVSEDLAGTWAWEADRLVLNLNDLAVDEETGEAGGRFRMDGPVTIVDQGRFDLTIAPDVYRLKRCP